MNKLHRLVTPWLWPRDISDQTDIGRRLGRVLHWCFVVAAVLSVICGIGLTATTYQNHAISVLEIKEWKKTHSLDAHSKSFINQGDNQKSNNTQFDWDEPTAVDAEPMILLGGAVVSFVLLLIGRAIRYVLAAE